MFLYVVGISGRCDKSDHPQLVTKPSNFPPGSFINNILPLQHAVHTIPSQTGQRDVCVVKRKPRGSISLTDAEPRANRRRRLQRAVERRGAELSARSSASSPVSSPQGSETERAHCFGCSAPAPASMGSAKGNLQSKPLIPQRSHCAPTQHPTATLEDFPEEKKCG